MAEIWENNYLALLAEVIGAKADDYGIREVLLSEEEECSVLTLIPDLPEEEYPGVEFRFTIEHILEGTAQLQIMVSMYNGVPAEKLPEAEKVIARINEFLILGHAAIFYAGGLIFYSHAFCIDRDMRIDTATTAVGHTLAVLVHTVPQVMEILSPVVNGSESAETVISRGIDLIQ
ncbi:MAG: hypothetical protein E7632_02045 [Ruminococcaceae bacterium]|nr:hypothetical protein [Oscillospiraceae bacterium]